MAIRELIGIDEIKEDQRRKLVPHTVKKYENNAFDEVEVSRIQRRLDNKDSKGI